MTFANGRFRKILVAYDGSTESEKALELGLAMASVMGSKVFVLAVAQLPRTPVGVELQGAVDDAHDRFDRTLERIARAAEDNAIELETAVAVGNPADQIVRRAEQDNADLIVVGRREKTIIQKLILNSVSERVVEYARCPVMVAR